MCYLDPAIPVLVLQLDFKIPWGKGIVLYLCVPAGVNCPTPSPKGDF